MTHSFNQKIRPWFVGLAFLMGGLGANLAIAKTDRITMSDPWIRQPPPSQRITALYGTIKNNSPTHVTIAGFNLEEAAQCELHQTVIDKKGVASMNHRPTYALKPGEALEMKPGGYHLMVMGLKIDLKKGGSLRGSLLLQDGESIPFEADVR